MPIGYGTVAAPSSSSAPDGSNLTLLQGKAAELIVAELHGKWYTAAYRGRVYIGSTAIAGTILATQSTTAATFALWNGSAGIVVEPVAIDVGLISTTTVIGSLIATFSNQVPTTTTLITSTVINLNVSASPGPSAHQASLFSAATITAATIFLPLFNITTTTTVASGQLHYDFDGKVVLPLNGLMCLQSTPTQTGATLNSTQWVEWPV